MWNGQVWQEDKGGCTKKAAQYTIAKMAEEIEVFYRSGDDKTGDLVYKHMKKSASDRARNDMLRSASPHIAVEPDIWNDKPNLLNLQNGTLELDTLKFREFRQEDYLTLKGGVKYDPDMKCPEWIDHLNVVFGEDKGLINDFQVMAGYSLLSGNPAQVFFVLYGSGKNGKSVTINTLSGILGDYAIHIAPSSLMVQKNQGTGPRGDLVRIRYKRFVASSEGDKSARLDIGWIKQITGGEPIVAAEKYKNEVSFRVEAAIWFGTNHLPEIREVNEAIWRRIWLIPFEIQISEEKRVEDYDKKIIESEGSGILNWCLEGLKRYYGNGSKLPKPEKVKNATEAYKQEEDPLIDFLSHCCVLSTDFRESATLLYNEYVRYCENEASIRPMSQKAFSLNLKDHNLTSERKKYGMVWCGIRLKDQAEIQASILENPNEK